MYAASLAAAETVMQALHDNIKGNSLMGFDLEWVSSAVNREVKATRPSLALHQILTGCRTCMTACSHLSLPRVQIIT
jgi:hypothetical protein